MAGKQPTTRFRISDELWEKMEKIIPHHKNSHRFGGGRPRVSDRQCMDGIYFVLRTGCQWKALDATGICSGSTAHSRFREWMSAGVFENFQKAGLLECDEMSGIDWNRLQVNHKSPRA